MAVTTERRDDAQDAGFTMMEILVAMAVFTVTMTIALVLIINTFDVLRSNSQRVAAANLATKQIEAARSLRALDVPDGASTRTESVGSTTYTITQDADYVVAGSGGSTCLSSGDQLAYKLVTVTVEWPDMAPVAPVRSDTLLALGVGDDDLDADLGTLAVGVQGKAAEPIAGATVTLDSGASSTTGTDGCVVFTGLTPGSYTAVLDRGGYVSPRNSQRTTVAATVEAGRIARAALTIAAERQARLVYVVAPGHTVPSGMPLHYRNSHVNAGAALPACGATASACLVPASMTARYLFPDVYDFWAGSCADARGTGSRVDLTPTGAVPTVPVPVGSVKVTVRQDGSPLAGQPVTAVHAAEGVDGCSGAVTHQQPVTGGGSSGSLGAVPFGTWTFTSGSASKRVTIAPGPGVTSVVLDRDEDDD